MEIEIRRLCPELADDYVHFFDITPHDQYVDAHKCYCVCWCADDYEGKDFSTAKKRRTAAKNYVEKGLYKVISPITTESLLAGATPTQKPIA